MFKSLVRMVAGDPIERALSRYREVVERINALEPAMKRLSDSELRAKTDEFKARLTGITELEPLKKAVDDLLVANHRLTSL